MLIQMRTEKIGPREFLYQRDYGLTLRLQRRKTDGDAPAYEVWKIQGPTAPGAIRDSRTERLASNPERAQSSHESHKLHGTNTDS